MALRGIKALRHRAGRLQVPGWDDDERAVIELDGVVAGTFSARDDYRSSGSVMGHVEGNVAAVVDADALAYSWR